MTSTNTPFTIGKYEKLPIPEIKSRTGSNKVFDILKSTGDIFLIQLKVLLLTLEAIFRLIIPVREKPIKGEIVLITGTGHGIGKELAIQYASREATVVCWDINEANNKETVKEISRLGYPKAYSYVCNVANRNEVMEISERVRKEVGEVTILINNAGIMPCHPFLEHTVDEIERIMNINVMAHYWTLQAFLPTMIKNNHGHIVALSSCAGLMGLKNLVPYCASKFAVRGMMEALLQDLYSDPKCRIKLTTIYPYMVDTGLCKNPKIKFQALMPLQNPKQVAAYIISAQRRDIYETTIPREFLSLNYYIRLLPVKVGLVLNKYLDTYVDSDLKRI